MNDATLPYPIDLPVKKRSINLVFDGGGGDKRSKRGGLSMDVLILVIVMLCIPGYIIMWKRALKNISRLRGR